MWDPAIYDTVCKEFSGFANTVSCKLLPGYEEYACPAGTYNDSAACIFVGFSIFINMVTEF